MSRLRTNFACCWMNSRRGSTRRPSACRKCRPRPSHPRWCTCSKVRLSGSIVVSHSCSGFISPSPLYRCMFGFAPSPNLGENLIPLLVVVGVAHHFVLLRSCTAAAARCRRIRFDDLPHVAVEERQQQRADVRAVHVGIGHDDDLVVARLGRCRNLRRSRCRAR